MLRLVPSSLGAKAIIADKYEIALMCFLRSALGNLSKLYLLNIHHVWKKLDCTPWCYIDHFSYQIVSNNISCRNFKIKTILCER